MGRKRHEPTIKEIRAILAEAGSLVTDFNFLDDVEDIGPITEEELDELTRDIPVGRSAEELVAEDRGEY